MPETDPAIVTMLQGISDRIDLLHEKIEDQTKVEVEFAKLREGLARLESKLDVHARNLVIRVADLEKRVTMLEGERRDAEGLAAMLKEAHKQLMNYRREETRPFVKIPPDKT
jgi:hypothetical protein